MREIKLSTFILVIVVLVIILALIICGVIYSRGIEHSIKKNDVYNEISQKVDKEIVNELHSGQTVNGVTIKVDDITYDKNFLSINYKIEAADLYEKISQLTNQEINNNFIKERLYMHNLIKVKDNNKTTVVQCIGSYDVLSEDEIQQLQVNSPKSEERKIEVGFNNEIEYNAILDISNYSFSNKIDIEVQLMSINIALSGAGPTVCEGPWNFTFKDIPEAGEQLEEYKGELAKADFKVEKEYEFYYNESGQKISTNNLLLNVNDADNVGRIVVDEARVSKLGTILHITTNFDVGQGNKNSEFPVYAIEIADSHGNIVMEKKPAIKLDETNYFAGKINANEIYFVRVYKYYCTYYQAFSSDYNFTEVETAVLRLSNSNRVN